MSGMFGRILVAYDDSGGARAALAAALHLAQTNRSEIVAVAVEAHLPHYAATVGEVEEEHAVERQTCARWLTSASAAAGEHGIPLATQIRAGHPAHEILAAAEACDAGLIVLGHSGHSQLWGRLIGSTTERVSRHAHCSVLIVR
ncbi:universal stress protein [Nonomuraea fuscirosea]|uniref:universal stress protein n=1 Tax=Nonomuraea fuscirosea TaxID=1291556 RepID=UPI002DD816E3|nr:universal stress protein [Nonomuraea fuscirosea]WSA50978.1 universal stress protein [Nonomuraea fuscirosea]